MVGQAAPSGALRPLLPPTPASARTPAPAAWGLALGLVAALGAAAAAPATSTVRPGENLSVIAARLGVSVRALRAANPDLKNPDHLLSGRRLRVPGSSATGAVPGTRQHTVRPGENLTVLARAAGLRVADLLAANPRLSADRPVLIGSTVRIPARSGPLVRPASLRGAASPPAPGWRWPLRGVVSSGFGERTLEGQEEVHLGVDIVAPIGTPVRAARAGTVEESRADFERGWGWTIIVDHGDGWRTRYAHLSVNLARAGERVVAGQVIGRVGNTGRSTGPHLHFGTYQEGVPRDPQRVLAAGSGE